MESEAEHRFRLWFRRSWSGENCMVRVASGSRSGRINQSQCLIPGLAIGWFFRFSFKLRQPSFHWTVSDGVLNGIGRNGNVLVLPIPIPSSLWVRLLLRFSFFSKSNTLFQNGRHFSVLLFSCKLALVASFLNSKFKTIFSLKWGNKG